MSEQRLINILRSPHISEKSSIAADKNGQVVFKVAQDASKPEIKAAVEMMFNVQVDAVQTLNSKGKKKMFGRNPGRRNGWKKAYVTLKPGQDIDFLAGE